MDEYATLWPGMDYTVTYMGPGRLEGPQGELIGCIYQSAKIKCYLLIPMIRIRLKSLICAICIIVYVTIHNIGYFH